MIHETRKLNISAKIKSYPVDKRIQGRKKLAKKEPRKQMDPPKGPVAARWPLDNGSGPQPETVVTHSDKWFNSAQNTVNLGISVVMPDV